MVHTVDIPKMISSVVGHLNIIIKLALHSLVGDVCTVLIKSCHAESGLKLSTRACHCYTAIARYAACAKHGLNIEQGYQA